MKDTQLDISIQATLAFYGAQRWPLTIIELSRRLIPPRRLGASSFVAPSIGEVHARVLELAKHGRLRFQQGLVASTDMPEELLRGRVFREKEWALKWRRMRPRARWLYAVPFTRSLLASGSLALGSTGPESDWDVFVIAEQKRLYTVRAGLLLAAALMGRLRRKHDRVAADRFCFNHYITTDALAFQHRSLYTAQALSLLTPIVDPDNYLARFWQANQWTRDWCSASVGTVSARRQNVPAWPLRAGKMCVELILRTPLGDVLESLLRRWQQRRIHADPATAAPGGRVVATQYEIEFHPRSAEQGVLAVYNRYLHAEGFGRFAERDSGLN